MIRKGYWTAFTAWHARDEPRLPYWPRQRIVALQRKRVRAIVAHAYATVPYYRQAMEAAHLRPADFQSADDLARLPLISGDDVARNPERFLSRRYASGGAINLLSSGTSGRARPISHDPAALLVALAHGHRQRLVFAHFVGRSAGYREMIALRPGNIGNTIRAFYESAVLVPRRVELRRRALSPASPFAENVARLNEFNPDVLVGYGSYLGTLFRKAITEEVKIARPRLIVYGGDRMPDDDRRLITTALEIPVLSTYQAAEVLRLGFQCELGLGFHMSEDHVAFRVVDKAGHPVGPGGTGEMVVSNLVNHATVILNYKLGDLVTVSEHPCPCGRTLPTIERIEGRADDSIAVSPTERVHALSVQAALHRIPGLIQVQIIQHELTRFEVRAVYVGDADWVSVRARIIGEMQSVLRPDLTVAVERVDALAIAPSDKVRAVVSYVGS